MGRTVTATARWVDCEVDMEEINTDDLVAELVSRKVDPGLPADEKPLIEQLYLALKLGQDDTALIAARRYVEAKLGVIL